MIKNPYDCFRSILVFGSGGGGSSADTGASDSDDIGSGGGGVGTWPRHDDEGECSGHLAQRVADVVHRLALHPEAVDFENFVTWGSCYRFFCGGNFVI